LLLKGQTIGAERAQQIGLVHELVAHDLLWARANQWTQEIALASPVAVALNKRVLNETVGESLLSSLASAAAATATGRTTEDAAEGVAAFVEKRNPKW
jgi:enoyl-CoA hydratase/carnithine racemase